MTEHRLLMSAFDPNRHSLWHDFRQTSVLSVINYTNWCEVLKNKAYKHLPRIWTGRL